MEPGPTADPALSYPSPTDLRFSELGSRDVKLHWTNPAKPVQQYRVVYHSAEGQNPQEVSNATLRHISYNKKEQNGIFLIFHEQKKYIIYVLIRLTD